MRRKHSHIKKVPYRALLSEMLPFELPPFMNNKGFCQLATYYGLKVLDGHIVATKHKTTRGLHEFLILLGGENFSNRKCFQYYVSKDNDSEGRHLAFIHPFHQLEMNAFYEQYADLLLMNCGKSTFSLRYPYKKALFLKNPENRYPLLEDENRQLAMVGAKNYFAYKHFNNINSFYGCHKFQNQEARFRMLVKMDIKSCFESITPQSLSTALYGAKEAPATSMAYRFAQLQTEFGNTDNGIVIGPEFSRIFSEMVMQAADRKIEEAMRLRHGKKAGRDYSFFRYVDDGFLFANDNETIKVFTSCYKEALAIYHLRENKKKREEYKARPFVTSIEHARHDILKLLDRTFENENDTFQGFINLQHGIYDIPMSLSADSFIKSLRIIMEDSRVSFKEIASFTIGILSKKFNNLATVYESQLANYRQAAQNGSIDDEGKRIYNGYRQHFAEYVEELMHIIFYLANNDFRVNNLLKTIPIVGQILRYLDKILLSQDHALKGSVHKKVAWEVRTIFTNNHLTEYNQIELLLLLDVLGELPSAFAFSEAQFFKFLTNSKEKHLEKLNAISLIMLLHHIRNKRQYAALHQLVQDRANTILESEKHSGTEKTLLLMELLLCPYVEQHTKASLLPDNLDKSALYSFLDGIGSVFVKWHHYNSLVEIANKYAGNVY